jgi:hypothetical protein
MTSFSYVKILIARIQTPGIDNRPTLVNIAAPCGLSHERRSAGSVQEVLAHRSME